MLRSAALRLFSSRLLCVTCLLSSPVGIPPTVLPTSSVFRAAAWRTFFHRHIHVFTHTVYSSVETGDSVGQTFVFQSCQSRSHVRCLFSHILSQGIFFTCPCMEWPMSADTYVLISFTFHTENLSCAIENLWLFRLRVSTFFSISYFYLYNHFIELFQLTRAFRSSYINGEILRRIIRMKSSTSARYLTAPGNYGTHYLDAENTG